MDCLRHNVDTSGEVDTEERREAREAAEWNSDCAFEADDDEGMPNWWENFKKVFSVEKLVDVNGVA